MDSLEERFRKILGTWSDGNPAETPLSYGVSCRGDVKGDSRFAIVLSLGKSGNDAILEVIAKGNPDSQLARFVVEKDGGKWQVQAARHGIDRTPSEIGSMIDSIESDVGVLHRELQQEVLAGA